MSPRGDRQTNTHPGFSWSRQRNGSLKRGSVSPCEAVICNGVFVCHVCLLGHDEALAPYLPNTERLRCHPLVYPTGEIKELPPHYSPHPPPQEARGCCLIGQKRAQSCLFPVSMGEPSPHCLMLGQGHLEDVRHPVSKVQALGAVFSSAEPSRES